MGIFLSSRKAAQREWKIKNQARPGQASQGKHLSGARWELHLPSCATFQFVGYISCLRGLKLLSLFLLYTVKKEREGERFFTS